MLRDWERSHMQHHVDAFGSHTRAKFTIYLRIICRFCFERRAKQSLQILWEFTYAADESFVHGHTEMGAHHYSLSESIVRQYV